MPTPNAAGATGVGLRRSRPASTAAARCRPRSAGPASACPAYFSNWPMPPLHHQVGRRRHRHLLQQAADHLRRDRIGHVGEQLDARRVSAAGRSRRPSRPGLSAARPRPARRRSAPAPRRAARSSAAPLPSGVRRRRARAAPSPPSGRRRCAGSTRCRPRRRRRCGPATVELPPWLPNTDAKIEKNRIGSRNVSACATRSRFRFVQLIAKQRRDHSLSSLPVRWMKTDCRLGPRTSTSSTSRPCALSAPSSAGSSRATLVTRARSSARIVGRDLDARRHRGDRRVDAAASRCDGGRRSDRPARTSSPPRSPCRGR